MKKVPENDGKIWSGNEIAALKLLAKRNTPTRIIAMKMKRTPVAIQSTTSKNRISLKPVNQSPYNRSKSRKK